MKKQVEMSIQDGNGNEFVAYPKTHKEHVQFENGMNIDEIVGQDIATPTITHDTTAIKVGVGDSDVSSSVVDSTVNMTIKGQTYQNILPDPTLRNEMQGKSMQRLNEGYDSIETVDGVNKSAILKGQTLVNGLSNPIIKVGGEYVTTISPTHLVINHGENTLGKRVSVNYEWLGGKMRDGADYTLDIWILKNTMRRKDDPTAKIGKINFNNYDTGYYSIPAGKTGHIVYEVTTPTTSTTERPHIETFTTCEGELEIQMVIREGKNLIPIEQHFEGMASCKMPVLQTLGSNIFDGETERGYIDPSTGQNSNVWGDLRSVGYTEVVGGNKIRILVTHENFSSPKIYEYDENKNFIGKVENHTLSPHAKFVRFSIGGNTDVGGVSQVMLYYGDIVKREYESYKTNILHTPEEVVLKGLGDVQDTLNVNTGEYVQRVKEVIYTGEEDGWSSSQMLETPKNISFYIPLDNHLDNTNNPTMRELVKDSLGFTNNCRSATVNEPSLDGKKGFSIHNNGNVYFTIPTSECANLDAWKSRLRTQPLVLQYPVKNPIIKTVDLSSHGNWEKVVLNGSENWRHESSFTHDNLIEFKLTIGNGNIASVISDRFATGGNDVERIACTGHTVYIRILKSKVSSLDEFKAWLQQNPVTVWYQTTTTQDNSIREMLSFANGHLQVSSEAENSLLPTVQYEIPTKNSYHMDLMKANTTYTMKLTSGNGSINKWDGESIGFMLSRTFNSGTLPKSNLFYTTGWVNDLMILEGDLNAKTIPYFKGIKSAFEGEDKIEVLSTGKNLYPFGDCSFMPSKTNAWHYTSGVEAKFGSSCHRGDGGDWFYLKAGRYTVTFNLNNSCTNLQNIGEGEVIGAVVKNDGWYTLRIKSLPDVLTQINVTEIQIVEESAQTSSYEPYKSNTTKIPLLSPLRSLPNGVCDELIIDRLNHKAKLIQRIAKLDLKGEATERWELKENYRNSGLLNYATPMPEDMKHYGLNAITGFISNNFYPGLWQHRSMFTGHLHTRTICPSLDSKIVSEDIALWLSKNPTTVLYELATPIITEIDLEGYPYAYKDGHIFLNSDVAPTTQITYSINQAQQIESANENLQRHEKEISHLQKLIAQYIQVEYESTLLSLKI